MLTHYIEELNFSQPLFLPFLRDIFHVVNVKLSTILWITCGYVVKKGCMDFYDDFQIYVTFFVKSGDFL